MIGALRDFFFRRIKYNPGVLITYKKTTSLWKLKGFSSDLCQSFSSHMMKVGAQGWCRFIDKPRNRCAILLRKKATSGNESSKSHNKSIFEFLWMIIHCAKNLTCMRHILPKFGRFSPFDKCSFILVHHCHWCLKRLSSSFLEWGGVVSVFSSFFLRSFPPLICGPLTLVRQVQVAFSTEQFLLKKISTPCNVEGLLSWS